MPKQIDINCDMGEQVSDNRDGEFMPFISSCSISCGAHAGTPEIIKRTIGQAVKAGLCIGAHPSYPDRENFGRHRMSISVEELQDSLCAQLTSFGNLVSAEGGRISYVKPHGALYGDILSDAELGGAVTEIISGMLGKVALYGLAHSAVEAIATHAGLRFVHEAFADRRYTPNLTLVSRREEGALIHSEPQLLAQLDGFVRQGTVVATDGISRPLTAESICIHSDTPNALSLARRIKDHLLTQNVEISSFL